MTTRQLATGSLALLALAGCSGAAAQDAEGDGAGDDTATVTAMGVGRASAPPDTMAVSLAVRTDGDSAAATMDEASLRTQQLLDAARGQDVAEEDLQTVSVQLFPRFDEEGLRIVGYTAEQAFTVRYRDLATAGGLLDDLVGVGGDFVQVRNLALEIDDPTALLAEARADAVRRAGDQAEQLAEAAGVELGDVRRVTEVPAGTSGEELDAVLAAGGRAAQDASVAVPLAGGAHEVTVQVALVHDID